MRFTAAISLLWSAIFVAAQRLGLNLFPPGVIGGILAQVKPPNENDKRFQIHRPPGPLDVRGPCPGLNTLANHNFIHHTGKSLTIPHLIRGLAEGMHMGGDFSTLLGATGLVASEHPFTGTFNLDDLDMHNWPTEHDVSVSRPDANLGGDYISFNETVWNSYISFFDGKPTMDVVTTAHARYARLQDSKKNNPKLVFGPKEEVLSLAENALILMTMGENKDWAKCFIEEEKLPFDQGWRPPREKITLISLGRKSVEILKHSPDLAPELKGVTMDSYRDVLYGLIGSKQILRNYTQGISDYLGIHPGD